MTSDQLQMYFSVVPGSDFVLYEEQYGEYVWQNSPITFAQSLQRTEVSLRQGRLLNCLNFVMYIHMDWYKSCILYILIDSLIK